MNSVESHSSGLGVRGKGTAGEVEEVLEHSCKWSGTRPKHPCVLLPSHLAGSDEGAGGVEGCCQDVFWHEGQAGLRGRVRHKVVSWGGLPCLIYGTLVEERGGEGGMVHRSENSRPSWLHIGAQQINILFSLVLHFTHCVKFVRVWRWRHGLIPSRFSRRLWGEVSVIL